MPPKLSVVIPVFNEADTVARIVHRLLALEIDMEIIAVDDGSTDASGEVLAKLAKEHPDGVQVITLDGNRGKGAAVRAGFARARGEYLLVQDADLEYDPEDIPRLLAKIEQPGVDVVYGSRILGRTRRGYGRYYVGGNLVSLVASILTRTHLSDEPCGYKMFPRRLLDAIDLECDDFGFCAELTAKLLRMGCTLREVPVNYHPRTFAEGKKINWRDGLKAIWYLVRYTLGS